MENISELDRLLINPMNLNVKEIDQRPQRGDKVEILDYLSFSKSDAVKYSKYPFLTIEESFPIVVGSDGDYEFKFNITLKEAPEVGEILSWHYRIL